jgi:hypothetical protein
VEGLSACVLPCVAFADFVYCIVQTHRAGEAIFSRLLRTSMDSALHLPLPTVSCSNKSLRALATISSRTTLSWWHTMRADCATAWTLSLTTKISSTSCRSAWFCRVCVATFMMFMFLLRQAWINGDLRPRWRSTKQPKFGFDRFCFMYSRVT